MEDKNFRVTLQFWLPAPWASPVIFQVPPCSWDFDLWWICNFLPVYQASFIPMHLGPLPQKPAMVPHHTTPPVYRLPPVQVPMCLGHEFVSLWVSCPGSRPGRHKSKAVFYPKPTRLP